jgi:hypothetical protein
VSVVFDTRRGRVLREFVSFAITGPGRKDAL